MTVLRSCADGDIVRSLLVSRVSFGRRGTGIGATIFPEMLQQLTTAASYVAAPSGCQYAIEVLSSLRKYLEHIGAFPQELLPETFKYDKEYASLSRLVSSESTGFSGAPDAVVLDGRVHILPYGAFKPARDLIAARVREVLTEAWHKSKAVYDTLPDLDKYLNYHLGCEFDDVHLRAFTKDMQDYATQRRNIAMCAVLCRIAAGEITLGDDTSGDRVTIDGSSVNTLPFFLGVDACTCRFEGSYIGTEDESWSMYTQRREMRWAATGKLVDLSSKSIYLDWVEEFLRDGNTLDGLLPAKTATADEVYAGVDDAIDALVVALTLNTSAFMLPALGRASLDNTQRIQAGAAGLRG